MIFLLVAKYSVGSLNSCWHWQSYVNDEKGVKKEFSKLRGVWDCSALYFATPLHRMLAKQIELRQPCSKKM
jgi:hypothetical protein